MKTCSFNGLSNFNRRGISQDQVNKKRTLLFSRSFLHHLLLLFLSFTAVTMFYLKDVSLNNTEKSRFSFGELESFVFLISKESKNFLRN